MFDTCPTVKIESAAGPIIINELDFDPQVHKQIVDAPPPFVPAPPPAPAANASPLDALGENWRDQVGTTELKNIAAAISEGRTVENREQAVAVIEAALAAKQ